MKVRMFMRNGIIKTFDRVLVINSDSDYIYISTEDEPNGIEFAVNEIRRIITEYPINETEYKSYNIYDLLANCYNYKSCIKSMKKRGD